ncbi:MAG: cation:proton antiporter [Kibdelosporangium sp.]
MHTLILTGHIVLALGAVLLIGYAGRMLARLLRQPPVIGEITLGLLAGPVAIGLAGRDGFDRLLPEETFGGLRDIGKIGLTLFLVGIAHHLQSGPTRMSGRTVGSVMAGAFFPPLALGGLLAWWLLNYSGPEFRGTSSTASYVVIVAVSLSVTAVPVLARILHEHGITGTVPGRVAMAAAAATDGVAWLLLGVGIGLASGGFGEVFVSMGILLAGAGLALPVRKLLRTRRITSAAARFGWAAAVLVAGLALAVGTGMDKWSHMGVVGAFLVGFAVPGGTGSPEWNLAVHRVSRVGRALVPIFFVVAGVDVFTEPMGGLPWLVFAVATVLAIIGKVGGSYAGARWAGQSGVDSLRIGVLMNTRGLTEIVVLQAGYSAGILPAALFLALLAMALLTTAMTGPLLRLIDRRTRVKDPSAIVNSPVGN